MKAQQLVKYSVRSGMDVNNHRVPSGVFTSIIAGAAATQGKNSSDLTQACVEFLDTFKFPTFEILVVLQVVLPVLYSFVVPCMAGFCVELCFHGNEGERATKMRKKTSSILIETWAHWYFHWEICSWTWIVLAITYLSACPLNSRYYEFTVGMSVVSITVSCMSNLLSDYRLNLPQGWSRRIFNVSCFLMTSWLLRLMYPCCMNIYGLESENPNGDAEMSLGGSLPPPTYTEALREDENMVSEEPPSYNETISRIRKQLPKLSRSISVSAHKLGRQMSVKRTTTNPEATGSVGTSQSPAAVARQQQVPGGSLKEIKKALPNRTVNQSFSMVEDRNTQETMD